MKKKYKPINDINYYFKLDNLYHIFDNISSNKLFIGIMMIFLNISSRYIELKLTKGQEIIFKNIAREILIFTIAFVGTKDIILSLIITAVFIILSNFVLNENCKYNILPNKYKDMIYSSDNLNIITKEDIEKANRILEQAKKQENFQNKITLLNTLQNNQ